MYNDIIICESIGDERTSNVIDVVTNDVKLYITNYVLDYLKANNGTAPCKIYNTLNDIDIQHYGEGAFFFGIHGSHSNKITVYKRTIKYGYFSKYHTDEKMFIIHSAVNKFVYIQYDKHNDVMNELKMIKINDIIY